MLYWRFSWFIRFVCMSLVRQHAMFSFLVVSRFWCLSAAKEFLWRRFSSLPDVFLMYVLGGSYGTPFSQMSLQQYLIEIRVIESLATVHSYSREIGRESISKRARAQKSRLQVLVYSYHTSHIIIIYRTIINAMNVRYPSSPDIESWISYFHQYW